MQPGDLQPHGAVAYPEAHSGTNWPDYLAKESLFDNAVRLRYFLWTIQRLIPRGSRLLEAGCGSGATAVLLTDLGYRVTALDREAELVERIRERYRDWLRDESLEVLQGDMFHLPWPTRTFDLAYHQGVLEHHSDENIVRALAEQARVARRVVFDVPNHRYGAQPFGDERLLPNAHWKGLIREAGLQLESILGRDFHHWLYFLPHAVFTRRAMERMPWFTRNFAVTSIFVCRPLAESGRR